MKAFKIVTVIIVVLLGSMVAIAAAGSDGSAPRPAPASPSAEERLSTADGPDVGEICTDVTGALSGNPDTLDMATLIEIGHRASRVPALAQAGQALMERAEAAYDSMDVQGRMNAILERNALTALRNLGAVCATL